MELLAFDCLAFLHSKVQNLLNKTFVFVVSKA